MSLIGILVHDLTSKAGDSLDLQEGGPVRGRSHPYSTIHPEVLSRTLSNSEVVYMIEGRNPILMHPRSADTLRLI